jgi:LysR family hydrogen peroxide-inducible transcriptional activator
MEARQINYFLAACATLNFTRAAENCNVAVPTLTRAIKALEDEVEGQLFRRERRSMHLTDLGRLMQQHLESAQQSIAAAKETAQRFNTLQETLKLGVISTMPSRALIGFLKNMRSKAPDLELKVWESYCSELGGALRAGEIDVALMSSPEYEDDLRALALMKEAYMVAFPEGHRFEAMNAVPLRELEGQDYVKRMHCEFPSNFMKLGVSQPYKSVKVRYVSEREDWVQGMVLAGLGLTLMPERSPLLPNLLMRPIVEPEVTRTISLVTVAGRPHSEPVKLAVNVARETEWR